jgi:hypothetical protein
MTLTVDEASAAYQQSMRNVSGGGSHPTCSICHTFIGPDYDRCYQCGSQPNGYEVVVPVSFSEHAGQLHLALRNYKDSPFKQTRDYAWVRLTAILWRFLARHESCMASKVGIVGFDLVTAVPSSDPARDRASSLRAMVEACVPVQDRFEQLLEPTGSAEGRDFDPDRYRGRRPLKGESVLVVDDTWTTGGHAQSAASALQRTGAGRLALVVIGRHLNPRWKPDREEKTTCGDIFAELPPFDWNYCVANAAEEAA